MLGGNFWEEPLMDTPAETKQPWNVGQWVRDYGVIAAVASVFAALLLLGLPGLYYLGTMSAELRNVEATIKGDLKPELRALREEVALLREVNARLSAVEMAIREELKPELRTLREEMKLLREQFAEMRTEFKTVRDQFGEIRAIVLRIENQVGELAKAGGRK
jgi:predicted nuclease with TOPRIM domain